MKSTTAANRGSNNDIQQNNSTTNTKSQSAKLLAYLYAYHSITTLQARNELFIMSPAARIMELKEQGNNIITERVTATNGSKKRIARYVLLAGAKLL